MSKKIKVLDCKCSDYPYLHKDVHGALCYAIQYLDDTYGHDATRAYLEQVGRTVYRPLIQDLIHQGISAMENHLRHIFSLEGGDFHLAYEEDVLVLTVQACPAISHLRSIGQLFTDRYCETSVVVNETICKEAGFKCSCSYEPGKGTCVQKFWRTKDVL